MWSAARTHAAAEIKRIDESGGAAYKRTPKKFPDERCERPRAGDIKRTNAFALRCLTTDLPAEGQKVNDDDDATAIMKRKKERSEVRSVSFVIAK